MIYTAERGDSQHIREEDKFLRLVVRSELEVSSDKTMDQQWGAGLTGRGEEFDDRPGIPYHDGFRDWSK